MSYTVALTGGICSGKSTVAHIFAQYGVDVIDADMISRQIVKLGQPALMAIKDHFGAKILQPDGTLNRATLRKMIFSVPEEKIWLDRLLHPLIHAETRRQIMVSRSPWCLWVTPLLIENHMEKLADRILVIDVDPIVQIERTITRDHITYEQAKKIIASQSKRNARLMVADDIIENSGRLEDLRPLVAELYQRYISLSEILE